MTIRILGRYSASFTPPAPTVEAALRIPRLGREAKVAFLIDTGASRSTLMPFDSATLRLNERDFDSARSDVASGIGGAMRSWVENAELHFLCEDGGTEVVTLEIGVAEPSRENLVLPSLLGRDVLSYYRFTADARTGEVILERDG